MFAILSSVSFRITSAFAILICLISGAAHAAAPVRISLRTTGGQYVVAGDASQAFAMVATADGVGYWETFTLERADGGDPTTVQSGDFIRLRTFHGRYVSAQNAGGAALTGNATRGRQWETFRIEKLSGSGLIGQGDPVTLRTDNGTHFVMAVNAGGGAVSANSRNRAQWETFSIRFENARLVRLSAFDSSMVAAQNGGGGAIVASVSVPGEWRTFTLLNSSRQSGLNDGDRIGLQAFSGKFLSAHAGGGGVLAADANRQGENQTFTIRKSGGGAIGANDSVWFQTANGTNFMMAVNGGGGAVTAEAGLPRQWETFRLQPAEISPIDAGSSISTSPGYSFAPGRARQTGRRRVAAFLIGFGDRPFDPTISNSDLRDFFFGGSSASISSWISNMTNREFLITNAGAFGPMTVPWNYVSIPDQDYGSGLMTLARERGFDFAAQDTNRDGTISSDELMLVILDCSNAFSLAQKRPFSFTFAGKTYRGTVFAVGINQLGVGVQGPAQLAGVKGTVLHEISHMLFDTPDRYYPPFPPTGDVQATGRNRAEWEALSFVRRDDDTSSVAIASGRRLQLQNASNGDFLVAGGSDFLNRGGTANEPRGDFTIEVIGGGPVQHGSRVALRLVPSGKYVMAKNGGGDVVQVVADRASTWETFTIEKLSGAGAINFGDPFTLRTSANNPLRQSFILMGIPEGRHDDPETVARGYWTSWNDTVAGGGAGGKYDIMDFDKAPGVLSIYDRFSRGWLNPAVLSPGNRACYMLEPSIETKQSFILWDPVFPDEWYTIENRQARTGMDAVPSNGLIVSWVNESSGYWARWGETDRQLFGAVISASASNVPPNMHVLRALLPIPTYRRSESDTAFQGGTYTLPTGEGFPSRFTVSFGRVGTGETMRFCLL